MAEKLNDKDKKLVWSLDEALRKRKELGKEGDVDLEKDLKVKQVDTSKDVLVYEYEVQQTPIEKMKNSAYCKVAKWIIVIACILALAGIIGAIVALALKATTPQTYAGGIGSSCNDTMPCDPTKGQVCTNGFCNCSSTTPTVISDTCYATEDYLGECSDSLQCDSTKSLTCLNGICDCDTLTTNPFWSSKNQKCAQCPNPLSGTTYAAGTWKYNSTASAPCFQVVDTALNLATAKTSCASSTGGLLFSASSQKKFEYLTSYLTIGKTYWIGGSYTPATAKWTWFDGTTISTSWSGWCSGAVTSGSTLMSLTVTFNNGTTACINAVNSATPTTDGYICEIA